MLPRAGRSPAAAPPRHREIFCFDKLTTSKDLKISPLFGEAWVTDQLPDTTSSPPRPASSPLSIDIDMHHTAGCWSRVHTLSLLWKLDRWKIGQSIGYYTKSGEQIFSQEGNTNYKIYIHSSQQSGTEFTQMQISFIMSSYLFANNQCSFIHTSCKIRNAMFALYLDNLQTCWRKNSTVHLTLSVLSTNVNWQMSRVSEGRMHVAVYRSC